MAELVGMEQRILDFYGGSGVDHDGRRWEDIVGWSDARLEAVHDFIQWLFPLPEPSPVNPLAPVLDRETIAAFRVRADLVANLRGSLERMLRFYGLALGDGPGVERAANFAERAENWLSPNNHNHLRITRILRCCWLLGLEAEARAFLEALEGIAREHPQGVTARSVQFWRGAVTGGG